MATRLRDAIPLDLESEMRDLGERARAAARNLAITPTAAKNAALLAGARILRERMRSVLEANHHDCERARAGGFSGAMLDRLHLDERRIEAMATGIEAVAALPDPVGVEMARWTRPNGLDIARVRVPLGVVGIIYESRPNVTADAGALCLKAGNAAILRGGSESFASSGGILTCLREGLEAAGLDPDALQAPPTADRTAVGLLLRMAGIVDVIVPRGGRSLIERVQAESRVPVLAHLEGICHVYIHESADPEMARSITLNAKMRRTGICGAAETLLVDAAVARQVLPGIVDDLMTASCEVRGDEKARVVDPRLVPAGDLDWTTEYLDAILSVRVVAGLGEAIAHINRFGSSHTDTIVTADAGAADRFLSEVDSAIVMHNASTQFADGGEFGMGAEVGIATGRLHARGPVGVEQLTTFKYVVRGTGQIRPH